jgi:cytochrome c oxidase subunit 2
MKTALLLAASAAALLTASSTLAAGDPAKGQAAYATCAACHGQNGEGNQAMNAPRLAGLAAWDLTRQLQNFKSGARGADAKDTYGAQMRPMAMTIPDAQALDDLVAYIGTLQAPPAAPTITGNADAGKAAFAVCAACHGMNGEGIQAMNAPKLSGQHDWYVARQLQNFKAGIRGTAPGDVFGTQMRPMAMTLADDTAINNIAAYIATLK